MVVSAIGFKFLSSGRLHLVSGGIRTDASYLYFMVYPLLRHRGLASRGKTESCMYYSERYVLATKKRDQVMFFGEQCCLFKSKVGFIP
jgi:hypothetical protein